MSEAQAKTYCQFAGENSEESGVVLELPDEKVVMSPDEARERANELAESDVETLGLQADLVETAEEYEAFLDSDRSGPNVREPCPNCDRPLDELDAMGEQPWDGTCKHCGDVTVGDGDE